MELGAGASVRWEGAAPALQCCSCHHAARRPPPAPAPGLPPDPGGWPPLRHWAVPPFTGPCPQPAVQGAAPAHVRGAGGSYGRPHQVLGRLEKKRQIGSGHCPKGEGRGSDPKPNLYGTQWPEWILCQNILIFGLTLITFFKSPLPYGWSKPRPSLASCWWVEEKYGIKIEIEISWVDKESWIGCKKCLK